MCDDMAPDLKKIGVWMSEKKSQKLNWMEFSSVCRLHGYTLTRLNLDESLEKQGPFDVFIHKLTDIIAAADQGDDKAKVIINNVENYISSHPNMVVLDPLDNVRVLLNRHRYYTMLESQPSLKKLGVFVPPFVELLSNDTSENLAAMKEKRLTFPVMCKPTVAHGSKDAHIMSVVFNERSLQNCNFPCVVQNFVNHNATLYKIFVLGESYSISERPSLKNFYQSETREPIHFFSGDVCKADSQSYLSILDSHDISRVEQSAYVLDESKVRKIIKVLKDKLKMSLIGFDVVIDNADGRYAIIDINVYPGYDNFPDFFENMLRCVDGVLRLSSIDNGVNFKNCDSKIIAESSDDSNGEDVDYISLKNHNSDRRSKSLKLVNVGVINVENNSNIYYKVPCQ